MAQVGPAAQVVAHRPRDAPHVGVVAVYRRLHQRPVADRLGHRQRIRLRQPRGHRDLDDVTGAFAVAHDVAGQRRAHLPHGGAQAGHARRARLSLRAAEQHRHVAGALVAVHGDGVERRPRGALQLLLQFVRGGRRIGDDERQHGAHVRLDHPGALGDAQHTVPGGGDRAAQLRVGIGGHDRLRRLRRGADAEVGGELRGRRRQGFHRELPADHPGRRRQQFGTRNAERVADARQHAARGRFAAGGAHVGHLVVDHHAAHRPPAVAAHDLHRRAGNAIAGQHRRPGSAGGRRQDGGELDRQGLRFGAQLGRGELGGGDRKTEAARNQCASLQRRPVGARGVVDLRRVSHPWTYSTPPRVTTTRQPLPARFRRASSATPFAVAPSRSPGTLAGHVWLGTLADTLAKHAASAYRYL